MLTFRYGTVMSRERTSKVRPGLTIRLAYQLECGSRRLASRRRASATSQGDETPFGGAPSSDRYINLYRLAAREVMRQTIRQQRPETIIRSIHVFHFEVLRNNACSAQYGSTPVGILFQRQHFHHIQLLLSKVKYDSRHRTDLLISLRPSRLPTARCAFALYPQLPWTTTMETCVLAPPQHIFAVEAFFFLSQYAEHFTYARRST